MIAIDASSFRRYLAGIDATDTRAVQHAMFSGRAGFPPPVLSELLSNPELTDDDETEILSIPILRLKPDFWQHAGATRRVLHLDFGIKAKLPDALIAHCCLDHNTPLITYDDGFRKQFGLAGLQLVI